MYKEQVVTLTLSGAAETKEGAFNKIFGQIKTAISKQVSEVIVRIEPQEVEVLSAKEAIHTEKFLGFLFPRQRTTYEITAKISVRLGIIEVSKIEFQQENHAHAVQGKQMLAQR
ncbi:DUF4312 family protein [Brevibacillus migulae]|uniref:DUF4312 family protein n=1 Tax=Brevibacillus migulae TaxID=1644114 RepID=UPI00106E0556|nr:DUF4312 family protein [Brevibacillus migulae]